MASVSKRTHASVQDQTVLCVYFFFHMHNDDVCLQLWAHMIGKLMD